MSTTRRELKNNAKLALRGNWGWAVLMCLINMIIVAILSGGGHRVDQIYMDYEGTNFYMQLLSPLGTILAWIGDFIALSLVISFLKLRDNDKLEKPYVSAFSVFTENRFGPECINFVMTSIFTFLWTLLLIIPGIIKSYSYAMTPYIVKDMVASGKQVGATDGINASRELMNGHKMDLFVFDLSFIGWFLLGGISVIGMLWVVPYYQTAKANFYRELAGNQFLK
ncbi:DUF975 family protein [Lactobacillus kefiranofaciens]|uniref:DUF975 family protein n=2 Tax=Lactobacillus kefiranofaciens TaxID=267818 RepID=A0AAX3UC83_9LACO|nr:DUF975 family protein [Lactobacillus kefiranofaciens]AEG41289.1 Hypothetical protein WANG_1594 [Lactobacillus kefiranofaciens subsp. kefiranofaciens]KRM21598.1 hypothetical protein FC93_GL000514 [Lactobacillus kefiranofaciens subsp. kefiranofaciens DSM 5016 = JCM 6985]MCJ2172530.1 DUF975 family protein [Lactobacillus kefiranofaciens]MCP9330621.1 DUF975 family protein [Lactobacillus kefiranofaciens]PAK98000.1 hypothetical protein B8W86_07025 [Lactobacillus kefiranofaciens]